ncbi:MAG TPA: hypothetical protein VLA96_11085 [Terriglobales bacterium]|nr:hypothetical protein [Terriglobales bacterium]
MTARAAMLPAGRRWRAYFAPVERETGTPQLFDPALDAAFALDAPPAPWLDLGWIESFARRSATETLAIAAGPNQAVLRQARKNLRAEVEFAFCDWGKLQMALAGGAQHMNVLAPAGSTRVPSGAAAAAAVPLEAGSTASQLVVGAGAVGSFAAGDLVVADIDYTGETGYVGSGLAGACVTSSAAVGDDPGYIRRVSFNVGRVAGKDATSLALAQPLPGGAPAANAKVQKVIGFTDREGGAFFQEWSGLFVFENEAGGRVILHYPRLQPAVPAAEGKLELAEPLCALTLHARFTALPLTDANDSEACLCWRTYYPVGGSTLY